MNQLISKGLLIAGIALITVPSTVLAQKEKDKEVRVKKEKENLQCITITRSGEAKDKMVIEIEGDKVLVNGKDIKDEANKDLQVNVSNVKGGFANIYRPGQAGTGNWNFDFDHDNNMSLFSEDENRAMLGVVTEGHDKGAVIREITKASGAEKAGLKKGDILTKIADRNIESTDDVTETIRAHKPGDKISINILRDGKEQTLTAELGKWKGIKMNAVTVPKLEGFGGQYREAFPKESPMIFDRNGQLIPSRPKLGLSIQDTDDGVGVKVLEVDEESNAAKAGVKVGDIIVGVNDHEVRGTDDVTKAMKEKEKTSFNFRVKRDGKTQNIEVKMPRKLKTADL